MGTHPEPLDPMEAIGVDRSQLPRHIAIIMDGNGRWAQSRGLPRIRGHEEGAKSVRKIVTRCARLGVEVLTLYSFSHENWNRPKEEVDFLMELYSQYLISERSEIVDNNVQFVHLGSREGLPDNVLTQMDITKEASSQNTGLKLCLALNYGSRREIIQAVKTIAAEVKDGAIEVGDIDEDTVSNALYSRGLPDPDLLIRTAGERRISNFLLWQISYAEIFVSEVQWPDFDADHLDAAIRDFAGRERRFGALQSI
ncbi:MAG TPA: isoprenyl transferase [Phycisphaerae bacterium]|nr:isoprenyl transferase [Phycisphaerae bacterium]